MKKLIIIALGVVLTSSAFAQGYIQFANTIAASTQVYTNTTAGRGKVPAVAGLLNYGLFIADGASAASNSLALAIDSSTSLPMVSGNSAATAGRFNTTSAESIKQVKNETGGTLVTVQVRAWSASFGNDWVTASTTPGAWWGASLLGSTTMGNASPGPALFGTGAGQLAGFDVFQNVPEPSTIALGALGLVGAFIIRRRK